MTTPRSERQYTDAELADARLAEIYIPESGPLYYATGDWWPTELAHRAAKHRRLAAAEDRLAAAVRREIKRWPTDSEES